MLYLPGSSQRMMAKAGSRGADVLVLDLEDGVHPDLKRTARGQIQSALERFDWGGSEVLVRVNALATPWGGEDLDVEGLGTVRVYTIFGRESVFTDEDGNVLGDLAGLRTHESLSTPEPPAQPRFGEPDPINTP